MINSYLCNGFVAQQIISELLPSTLGFSKRLGSTLMVSSPDLNNTTTISSKLPSPKTAMLYDPGSSGYVDWLSKSTTLDDIYRNYLSPSMSNLTNDLGNHRADTAVNPNLQQPSVAGDYFDEGVITGFAVQHPDPSQHPSPVYSQPYNPSYNPSSYNPSYKAQPYKPNPYQLQPRPAPGQLPNKNPHELLQGESRGDYYHIHRLEYEHEKEHHHEGKSLALKDLFDIALTTLAFLSFGMFILQVIMCLTMTNADTNLMVPVATTELTGEGVEEVRIGGRRRRRRSLLELNQLQRLSEINEIARKVLDSMDAAIHAKEDSGRCSQFVICEGNQLSTGLKYIRRYWMAVWNLGISWLTGNLVDEESRSGVILDCLKSMIVGLGGGDCRKSFHCVVGHKPGVKIKQ
ncbi:uncharacterized protein LOC129749419 isoform X2 [Uranotaenia lowii]|nr:uncharacterized protein LOC129749419 isoform X2 [Uranotaenia lowii]